MAFLFCERNTKKRKEKKNSINKFDGNTTALQSITKNCVKGKRTRRKQIIDKEDSENDILRVAFWGHRSSQGYYILLNIILLWIWILSWISAKGNWIICRHIMYSIKYTYKRWERSWNTPLCSYWLDMKWRVGNLTDRKKWPIPLRESLSVSVRERDGSVITTY